MNNDLITDNFAAGINQAVLKRILVLTKTVLALCILFCVIESALWYALIRKTMNADMNVLSNLYNFRIQPIVTVILFILSLTGYAVNVKAYQLINRGVQYADVHLFNKGYMYCYRAMQLSIAVTGIAIINAGVIQFLK